MDYILMHKRIPVAEMTVDEETSAISVIGQVFAPERIPVGISLPDNRPDRGDMNDWWQGRSIPASRQNIRKALDELGISSAGKLITRCFGLSLSDQYWVNPVQSPLDWDEINFFDNAFSEDVGDVLFGGAIQNGKINLVSPDNTSDGWLKKKWKIIDGKRCLVKGGSDPYQQQPVSEAMAALVMNRLQIPHVPYTVIWENGLPYSVCENFLSSETELVSAFYIHNTLKLKDAGKQYDHYIKCCDKLGIPGARVSLDQMLAVDFLIANSDRHYNNFGAVRNANTLEWIAPAPLYDNGSSFWYNQTSVVIRSAASTKSQPFCDTHEEQIKLIKNLSWLDLSGLRGLDEEIHEFLTQTPHIDADRRDAICLAVGSRAKLLADYAASIQ
jgi:hypothetical protein